MFYETFDHSADLGIRIYGENIRELFINAGRTLFCLIAPAGVDTEKEFLSILVTGEDTVDLLINWLRELLYLFYGKERLVTSFHIVSMDHFSLNVRVEIVGFDDNDIDVEYEIKAVTYHQARIESLKNGYVATVIFDL
ncbi:MAG: archease [Desulfobacteraceae bacterium]|jgi:SHS2 domain-containing protein